jgi:hypothetical protein
MVTPAAARRPTTPIAVSTATAASAAPASARLPGGTSPVANAGVSTWSVIRPSTTPPAAVAAP